MEQNLSEIRRRLNAACERAGRAVAEVEIMAVSKTHSPEMVRAAADLGIRLFGESRIQEARLKIPQCPGSLRWHLIGHLQTNKARDAVSLFEMIQSVDSLRLAEELQKRAEAGSRNLAILLEVNVAGESTKFGFPPEQLLEQLPTINRLSRLEVHGLMCMAPYSVDPERIRPVFRRCRELAARCGDILGAPLPTLSMGMSLDFEVAVEEGSTLVRLGSALFGERPTLKRPDSEEAG